MTVRWSPEAAADFDSIIAYLLEHFYCRSDRAHGSITRYRLSRHFLIVAGLVGSRGLESWCWRHFHI
jgi:plasmid stabilization system protein ParE